MMRFDYDSVPDEKVEDIAASAYTTINGLKHGYLCSKYVVENKIHGAIVECGVANGAQVGVMARAVNDLGQAWNFHLFDSFDGIPMAGPMDKDQPGIGAPQHDVHAPIAERLVSSGISMCTREEVKANLRRWGCVGNFYCHEGWFQNTLPEFLAIRFVPGIALLRLDGDLYESTMVCLEHLYPHVVPGGLVIIDDYGLPGCKAAVHEYLEREGFTPELHIEDVGYPIATWTK